MTNCNWQLGFVIITPVRNHLTVNGGYKPWLPSSPPPLARARAPPDKMIMHNTCSCAAVRKTDETDQDACLVRSIP
eukprot:3139804-Prymnesium_polylepis.1